MRKGFLPVLLMLGLAPGCSSFRTTAIDRLENDTIVVNPEKPLKGVPVSLRIPTHLELSVIETTYWQVANDNSLALSRLDTCRATRTVTHDTRYTEKIFLVDPVRPGSGTASYGFTFMSGRASPNAADRGKGYLSSVQYTVDDTTIKDSAALLATSINFVNALAASANNPKLQTSNLLATDRVVAYGRFDINSCTFECDVASFLECHLNALTCEQACRATVNKSENASRENNDCPKKK